MDRGVILWHVKRAEKDSCVYICDGYDREGAKRKARDWYGGNPDTYIVTPLTNPGDQINLNITLRI